MILVGDCLEHLRSMESESVNCIVTSPPYWGLRDYGMPPTEWPEVEFSPLPGLAPVFVPAMTCCFGQEPTPNEYIAHLVLIFREIQRVLRKDGTCWLNLGDSYSGSWGAQSRGNEASEASSRIEGGSMKSARQISAHPKGTHTGSLKKTPGLKRKELIGIPWRAAFALQDSGWYLRSDVVWQKLNPMPESVKDRPTRSHEYLFLLTKSAKYWYDHNAIRMPAAESTAPRLQRGNSGKKSHAPGQVEQRGVCGPRLPGSYKGSLPGRSGGPGQDRRSRKNRTVREGVDTRGGAQGSGYIEYGTGANARTVWSIATTPYRGAHYAVYPEALPRRCILAGCPEGGIVLDPFLGSGTTMAVALKLGRRAVGIELNPEFAEMARQRLSTVTPAFIFEEAS